MLVAALEKGDDAEIEDDPPQVEKKVEATRGDTWIRALPGMEGAKRAVLKRGQSLPYGGDKLGEWLAVEYNGKVCYVHEKYVDVREV